MATKKKPQPTIEFVRKNHEVVARAHYDIQRLNYLCATLHLAPPVIATTMVQFSVGELYKVSIDLAVTSDDVAEKLNSDLYVPESIQIGGHTGVGEVEELDDLIGDLEQALADRRQQAEKEERLIAKLRQGLTSDEVALLRKISNRV